MWVWWKNRRKCQKEIWFGKVEESNEQQNKKYWSITW